MRCVKGMAPFSRRCPSRVGVVILCDADLSGLPAALGTSVVATIRDDDLYKHINARRGPAFIFLYRSSTRFVQSKTIIARRMDSHARHCPCLYDASKAKPTAKRYFSDVYFYSY